MKKLILVLSIAFSVLAGCNNTSQTENKVAPQNTNVDDLKRIIEEKKLNVVVDYSSTSYFVYKGQPMGFQYELLKALAKDLDVELDVHISNNLREAFEGINSSELDLIAKNLTVTRKRNKIVDFTEPLALTRQVLIQRSSGGEEGYNVNSTLDLAGKTIYVQQNSAYVQRLKNLSEEIGESITIV
ncbi:MAG TPA: transporter substrate-binding domain-containing protein, partial [Prolixibacteraceae bacterium]|nr:transporter substrate-binding domain-containing protein [Prolixibacteraceae bacterium]